MDKRVFVLDKEEIFDAFVQYIQNIYGENSDTDRGQYSLRFIPHAECGHVSYDSVIIERKVK